MLFIFDKETTSIGPGCDIKPMSYSIVKNHAIIKVGDEVITSGLGDVYPPGILVGHIISVNPAEAGQFPEVVGRVASSAGLQHQVMVLLKKKIEDGTE